ncbi:phospholipase D family protein [Pedobacter aquatilis]|uniref:phospholipase D family protein n=1 Tax=Pedobacter aquatilis TaxID=351343 RepID=UPI00292F82DA|nr:phospholipase D family protein [Pedobacter aquatilis]
MELKFIGQGLNPLINDSTGLILIESLEDTNFDTFNAFVAFLSSGGIKNLLDQLNAFTLRGGKIKLFVGVDLNGTSKEALEKILELGIECYITYSPNNIIYHPKIYTFEGPLLYRAIIGSSNMTERGLFQSVEASTSITFEKANDIQGMAYVSSLLDYYKPIITNTHESTARLTQELLAILIDAKVVVEEKVARAKHNKINKVFQTKDVAANARLNEVFAKLKVQRAPKGYSSVVAKSEVNLLVNHQIEVVSQTIELQNGSMWIQTGRMTGGSKNQLDMSKSGQNVHGLIQGSVSHFGIDANDPNEGKSINITLGDTQYIGNPILFTPDNGNWRIQFKGVSLNGDKLTDITRENAGHDGGFVNKILLFTPIQGDDYRLEILEIEERDRLIEHSNLWGTMGRVGTGRAYGFIQI